MLLHLLEKVCKNHIHDLEEPLANDLIELASTELTKDPVSQCFYMHVQQSCTMYMYMYMYMLMRDTEGRKEERSNKAIQTTTHEYVCIIIVCTLYMYNVCTCVYTYMYVQFMASVRTCVV